MYIQEELDRDALFALRANRQMVSKVDSNGDLFVRLTSLIDEKPLDQKRELLKPRGLKHFLLRAFRYDTTHVGRELQVLRNEALRPLFLQFCRTRYGAENFTLTWASSVVLGNLDYVSLL